MDLRCVKDRSRRLFQRHQRVLITKIPQEILEILWTYLTAPDQVCLALTCRYFYNCFLLFLKDQGIQLRQLFPSKRQEIRYRKIALKNQPKVQLLHQLQNRRWRYCSDCWKLHRHSVQRYLQHLCSNRSASNPIRSHNVYSRAQDICPCLAITLSDKVYLTEAMKQVAKESKMTLKKNIRLPTKMQAKTSQLVTTSHNTQSIVITSRNQALPNHLTPPRSRTT